MDLYIVTAVLLLANKVYGEHNCTGIYLKDKYYDPEIIREGINNIRQLAINRKTNILYFSFDLLNDELTSNVGFINLDTDEVGIIDGVKNARTIAVDQRNNLVYVGGETGVYVLNDKNVPEKLPIDDNVLKLFYGYDDNLYYTTVKKESYKYYDGEVQGIFELFRIDAEYLVIDNSDHIFFVDNRRLFRIQLKTKAVNIHEKVIVNCLTTDLYGNLYVCTDNGIYMYNRKKYSLVKVAKLSNVKDLVFDRYNEPIYAVYDKIIKLNTKTGSC